MNTICFYGINEKKSFVMEVINEVSLLYLILFNFEIKEFNVKCVEQL